MKRSLLLGIILGSTILFNTHCTFQKRLYKKGYYVEWLSNTKQKNKKFSAHTENIQLPVLPVTTGFSDNKKENENLLAEIKDVRNASIYAPKNKSLKDTCGDKLILKSGDEYIVKVVEINDKEIKYKRCDNLDGPLYTISTSKVYLIEYANGTKEHILSEPENEPTYNYGSSSSAKASIDDKNKIFPPSYVISWVLFALSVLSFIPHIASFTGWAIFVLMFTARHAKRYIKQFPDKYKGLGAMNFLMYFSFILVSLAAFLFLILGIIFMSTPSTGNIPWQAVGLILFLIGVLFAIPVIVFLFTSKEGDF